jgi:hypothetical protein
MRVGRVRWSGRRLWWTLKGSAAAGVIAGAVAYAAFGLSWQQSVLTGALPAVVPAFVTQNARKAWPGRAGRQAARRLRWFAWVFAGGMLSSLAVAGTVMLLRHAGQDPGRGSILIALDFVLIWGTAPRGGAGGSSSRSASSSRVWVSDPPAGRWPGTGRGAEAGGRDGERLDGRGGVIARPRAARPDIHGHADSCGS